MYLKKKKDTGRSENRFYWDVLCLFFYTLMQYDVHFVIPVVYSRYYPASFPLLKPEIVEMLIFLHFLSGSRQLVYYTILKWKITSRKASISHKPAPTPDYWISLKRRLILKKLLWFPEPGLGVWKKALAVWLAGWLSQCASRCVLVCCFLFWGATW